MGNEHQLKADLLIIVDRISELLTANRVTTSNRQGFFITLIEMSSRLKREI